VQSLHIASHSLLSRCQSARSRKNKTSHETYLASLDLPSLPSLGPTTEHKILEVVSSKYDADPMTPPQLTTPVLMRGFDTGVDELGGASAADWMMRGDVRFVSIAVDYRSIDGLQATTRVFSVC
jgi:hypothetical protein